MTTEWTIPPVPFSRKEKLIVGVSGGSDSLGLLLFLLEELSLSSERVVVAHVNYCLRGKNSDKDEAAVRRFCRTRHLSFRCLKVPKFRDRVKKQKRSLQDLAREIRYSFFTKLTRKEGAWGTAVAHHLEDHAETVLDHLLRGAGPRGLSGLRPLQVLKLGAKSDRLKVWRPLLALSKGQIRDFLKSRKIKWREDGSNQKNDYRRNQIRNEILPFLSKWNPKLMEVLARIGEITAAEDQFMEDLLISAGRKMKSRWTPRAYIGQASSFQRLPVALKRRWIRSVAEKITHEARGLSFDRIEEIIRLWEGRERGPRDLGFNLTGGRIKNQVFLRIAK